MDDRAWQLIKLLNDKNYTTAAQLAEQIGVSGKTIRNRLKLLSEELEMHGAELESCTGYGYRLHIVDPAGTEWRKAAFVSVSRSCTGSRHECDDCAGSCSGDHCDEQRAS